MLVMSNSIYVFSGENAFELKFDKDKISTTVYNAVIRGDRDAYHFNSNHGQRISIAITSIEDNAVFVLLYKKNGAWKAVEGAVEAGAWYGKLPESDSNRYAIEVGGTRGNASYSLFVGISVADY